MSTQEQYPTEIKCLFNEQKKLYYPNGVEPVSRMLCSTAFFPGGSGLWNAPPKEALPYSLQEFCSFFKNSNPPTMPKRKIMILANDFGSKDGYERVRNNPYANLNSSSTWRNLLELLYHAGIKPKNCFFTNAYMGLRLEGEDEGPSPGAADREFIKRCEAFFLDEQISVQKPCLILALGKHAIRFIARLSPDLTGWKECKTFPALDNSDLGPLVEKVHFKSSKPVTVVALVHPSRRKGNVWRRRYRGAEGEDAELAMLKDALKQSGLY